MKRTRVLPTLTEKHMERFTASVDKTPGQGPNGDCWEWTRGRFDNGYGSISIKCQSLGTHRVAFCIANGRWAQPFTLHTCDNPPCCRPEHLFEGTPAVNADDRAQKNRGARFLGDEHPSRRHPERVSRGEIHYRAKFTEDAVRQIRSLCQTGKYRQIDLAVMFGAKRGAISKIVRRERWAHVA